MELYRSLDIQYNVQFLINISNFVINRGRSYINIYGHNHSR